MNILLESPHFTLVYYAERERLFYANWLEGIDGGRGRISFLVYIHVEGLLGKSATHQRENTTKNKITNIHRIQGARLI